MTDYSQRVYLWVGWMMQFALACGGFAVLLHWALDRQGRWRISRKSWRHRGMPAWFVRVWQVHPGSIALQERTVLLAGCGLRLDPVVYLTCRRMIMTAAIVLAAATVGLHAAVPGAATGWWKMVAGAAAIGTFAYFDGAILHSLRRYRTERIRRELILVSSQLLYYTNSRLHLHGKLMKCLAFTRAIRSDLVILLNEWYHDPDGALQRFKDRLGTDEGYSFAESIRSLRLHENKEIYHLLRELVREYKARLELARESRKETTSYLLFVLAGIPILYTFQIFLYPWVQEAARLFSTLNA